MSSEESKAQRRRADRSSREGAAAIIERFIGDRSLYPQE